MQLTLAEKLQLTRELIKFGYESPFMDELKAAEAAEPDFLRYSQARRSSRRMSFNNGLHPMKDIKNGDLPNGVGDGTVSIDIEQNWNLNAPSSARKLEFVQLLLSIPKKTAAAVVKHQALF